MARNRLTWRDVAAPNFSGVSDSYKTMSKLLGNATKSGMDMVDTFTGAQSDAADRAIQQRMLNVRDSSQFDPSAILGGNADKASMEMLQNVGKKEDTLIERGIKQDTHGQNQKNWGWLNDGREQSVENSAAINEAQFRALNGDKSGLRELQHLRSDLYAAATGDVDRLTTSDLSRDSTTQRMGIAEYGQNRLELSDEENDKLRVIEDDMDMNAFDADSRRKYILGREDLTPELRQRALQRVGSNDGEVAGLGSIGPSGFTMDIPQQAASSSLASAGFSPHVVAGFLGNFHAEGGYTGAEGDSGTAGGIVQWRGPRRENFKSVIGKDPTKASPEEQMEFVKWEMDNPTHPSVGMTVGQRDQILNAPDAGTAAELIDKFYERSSGEHRDKRVAAANDAYAMQKGQSNLRQEFGQQMGTAQDQLYQNVGNLTSEYLSTLGNNNFPNEAAEVLAKKLGPGADPAKLLSSINKLIRGSKFKEGPHKGEYGVNAAQAAAALELSLVRSEDGLDFWGLRDLWHKTGTGDTGRSTNMDFAADLIDDITSGAVASRITDQVEQVDLQNQVNQANQYRDQVAQRLQKAASMAEDKPNIAVLLPDIEKELEEAIRKSGELAIRLDNYGKQETRQDYGQNDVEPVATVTGQPSFGERIVRGVRDPMDRKLGR